MNKTYIKLTLDLNFVLIAITSSLKDYMLCHQVNKALTFDFAKTEDHKVFFYIDEEPQSFSKYFYCMEEGGQELYLVSNRNREGFLVPEMKKVDFFMIVKPYLTKESQKEILIKLNKIADVQVAAVIDICKLKSKENLIM